MAKPIIAARNQINVPISKLVSRDGGIAGLTLAIKIFNGANLSEFLDFNDGFFKDAAHVTPTLALTEEQATESPGLYVVDGGFDLSAITVPAAASSLLVRYEITAGGETGDDVDTIVFARDAIASPVWDRELKGSTHNIPTSAGRRLRELSGGAGIADGIAQGGAAQAITLEVGETSDDDFFQFMIVAIVEFTGVGQIRIVTGYDGTTKIATVDRPWDVVPDNTSSYLIGRYQAAVLTADTLDVARDAILNDATRFAGANIDAQISSRESEAAAATREATNTAEHAATLAQGGPGPWTTGSGGAVDWTAAEREQMRDAMGVDGAKTAAVGGQLQTIGAAVALVAADVTTLEVRTTDLDAAIAFFGALLGTPVTHTPTTVTAGAFTWSVVVAGPSTTFTRLT